jgi:hypothetical protein
MHQVVADSDLNEQQKSFLELGRLNKSKITGTELSTSRESDSNQFQNSLSLNEAFDEVMASINGNGPF